MPASPGLGWDPETSAIELRRSCGEHSILLPLRCQGTVGTNTFGDNHSLFSSGTGTGKETPSTDCSRQLHQEIRECNSRSSSRMGKRHGWHLKDPSAMCCDLNQGSGPRLLAGLEEVTTIPGPPGGSNSVPICVSNGLL